MRKVAEEKRLQSSKPQTSKGVQSKRKEYGIKPAPGYVPRFKYNGYLKNCTWIRYTDEMLEKKKAGPSEQQEIYKRREKAKFCILMAFAGGKYFGMQRVGGEFDTIELKLFDAMTKNKWILPEHVESIYAVDYCRASRTDRGVSAARMYCSALLRKLTVCDDMIFSMPFERITSFSNCPYFSKRCLD